MTRRYLFALAALCALLLGAGCGERGAPTIAEMDEALYIQGVQLNKQGRSGEALTSFLKVIDKRGERGAPESHLEAGVIYLNHTKEPVLAYYHFKRYLELQANSKEAPRVRAMLDAALRDIARRFPGRPAEDQTGRLAAAEEVAKLRRENQELSAELQTLRGGGAVQPNRVTRPITLPPESVGVAVPPQPAPVSVAETTIIPAPMATAAPATRAPAAQAPNASQGGTTGVTKSAQRQAPAQTRATAAPTQSAGRTHTVRQGEGLFAIARRYDPQNPGKKMREIVEANRDALPNGPNTPLKPGMTLRVP